MIEIFMPKAGMDMQEGTLIRWLKNIGDKVEKDEPIMEIETDKITMEAEAPGSGIFLSKLVDDGTVVPVLSVIGYIGEEGEKIPEKSEKAEETPKAEKTEGLSKAETAEAPSKAVGTTGDILATPYAKKLAAEKGINLENVSADSNGIIHAREVLATPLAKRAADAAGVDLADVNGSGFNGRIVKDDVEKYVQSVGAGSAVNVSAETTNFRTVEARKPLKGLRKVVGQRMFESYSQVPTVMQSMKVDMTELILFRKKINEGRRDKVSLNDFIIKATAMAVKELPHVRTMIQGDELVTYAEANIGFAVAVDGGLFVPVIKNADILSIREISRQAKSLAAAAREGKIKPDDCKGATFTISNMGMYDVFTFNPIINQPESGILGITGIEDVLKMRDGNVVVRQEAVLCMSYDHRVMDGVGSAQLKKRVKELIEHPIEILI
ncbi:dihydrolipoamide acetyltransferase family protein [Frisingicoccus sp.]|uniref:dihydrolipoamide acetyltransferase family protein n=1 Tax=Frisingicoccus sp. TaxID=1918627 RepID=UPI003AB28C04